MSSKPQKRDTTSSDVVTERVRVTTESNERCPDCDSPVIGYPKPLDNSKREAYCKKCCGVKEL